MRGFRFLLVSLFILVATTLVGTKSFACSCSPDYYEFSKVAKGKIVIKGKVVGYGPKLSHGWFLNENMDVEGLEVIQGELSHSKLTFEGDKGADCLHYIDRTKFSKGSEFLLIVVDDEPVQYLWGCSETYLQVKDGKVHGEYWKNQKSKKYVRELDKYISRLED